MKKYEVCTGGIRKNTILRWPIALWFFNLYVEQKTPTKAVAWTMIFKGLYTLVLEKKGHFYDFFLEKQHNFFLKNWTSIYFYMS